MDEVVMDLCVATITCFAEELMQLIWQVNNKQLVYFKKIKNKKFNFPKYPEGKLSDRQ